MSILTRRGVTAGFFPTPVTPAEENLAAVALAQYDLTAEDLADTTAISSLTDQTGNGHALTQGTGALQPTAQTVSGMKVARFDGSDDYLQVAFGSTATQPNVYIALAKFDDPDTNSAYIFDTSQGVGFQVILMARDGTWQYFAEGTRQDTGVTDDANWHVHVIRFDGANTSYYLDGGTPIGTTSAGTESTTGITMGAQFNGIANWHGDINFLSFYDGDLLTNDLALVNDVGQALANRAGITWTNIT